MTKDEIAARWPDAVSKARELREVFGDGVRLLYARNEAGDELGRRPAEPLQSPAGLPRQRIGATGAVTS